MGAPDGGFIVLVERDKSLYASVDARYVTAYWRERCEDTWMSGHYDMSLVDALQDMAERAGVVAAPIAIDARLTKDIRPSQKASK